MMRMVVLVFSPNLGRLRQRDLCESDANLIYAASLEPVSKQQKKYYTTAVEKLRQKDCFKFKASLNYRIRLHIKKERRLKR